MKKQSIIFILLILLISIINLRYFFKPGIFRAHDIENHLARIANYYLAVKDGHIPPRWARNLNHKFGYPVFNYNYPLANMFAYPLIVVGLNIEDSLKAILFFSYFFSGLFFYLWVKKHFNAISAFSGAVFYLCAPYQFLDLYVRGVVGENLSFALFPAVLYFLKLLSEKITKWRFLGLAFITALFSLSHNIMVLIFTPLIFIYWFYLFSKAKPKVLKLSLSALVLGFLLTSFFWIPALAEKKYVALKAFDIRHFYLDHFVFFKQLLYSPWQFGFSIAGPNDTMSFQVGPIHLFVFFFLVLEAILLLSGKKIHFKKEEIIFLSAGLIIVLLSVFLMLPISKFFWKLIPFLGYLQFPWRFLSLIMFGIALLTVVLAERYKILSLFLILICFIYAQQFTKPFLWQKKSDMFYYDFLFTTSVRHENRPLTFNEENISKFKSKFTSDSDLVKFHEIAWKTGKHIYEVDSPTPTNIWEHTAYFPGWKAFIDGKKAKILYNHKGYDGIIGLKIPRGCHQIRIRLTEDTPARIIGDCLSLFSLTLIIYLVFKKKAFNG